MPVVGLDARTDVDVESRESATLAVPVEPATVEDGPGVKTADSCGVPALAPKDVEQLTVRFESDTGALAQPAIGTPLFSKLTVPAILPEAALTTARNVTAWFEAADGVPTARLVWLAPICVSVAWVESPVSDASVAVIVTGPGVVELVMVADQVPSAWLYAGVATASPRSLELSVTSSLGLAFGSSTVIVAVVCEAPSAAMVLGESCKLMFEPSAQAGAASQQPTAVDAIAMTAACLIRRTSHPLLGPR